jgi:hypothetical protein
MHLDFVVDTERGKFGVSSQKLDKSQRGPGTCWRGRELIDDGFPPRSWKSLWGMLRMSQTGRSRYGSRLRALYTSHSERKGLLAPTVAREGQWPFPTLLLVAEAVFRLI